MKNFWDTAPMQTSKKISITLAVISAVMWTIGIQLVDLDVKVALVFIYVGMVLYGLAVPLFLLDEKWVKVKTSKDR